MIIEIKDLPTNRNVKSVNFNIEFEDGEIEYITQEPIDRPLQTEPQLDILDDIPDFKSVPIDTTKTTGVNESPEITSVAPEMPVIDISNREPSTGGFTEESF